LEALRIVTILVSPVLPTATERVWRQLGITAPLGSQRVDDAKRWGGLPVGGTVAPGAPVFPRIETRPRIAVAAGAVAPSSGPAAPAGRSTAAAPKGGTEVEKVTIDEFKRLDIRVGVVKAAERVPGTDKLLRVSVDTGDEVRTVVAGIATHYPAADLIGRHVVILANLQPRTVRGVESNGMLLAATGGNDLAILTVDGDVPPGTRVS
jgi:methionyl-tRNA synthetase